MSASRRLLPLARDLACHGLRILGDARACAIALPTEQVLAHSDIDHSQSEQRLYRVVLVGAAGPQLWPIFERTPEANDGLPDPLDRWSRRIGERLAQVWDCVALYPFEGPPFYPFQTWARQALPQSSVSPFGVLIHPRFGPWWGFRFALVWSESGPARTASGKPSATPSLRAINNSPCARCATRPCIQACPAAAVQAQGFDACACLAHLHTAAEPQCLAHGCAVRQACPVGTAWRQTLAQQVFHLRAFAHTAGRWLGPSEPN